jgi:large subunit ribosomal protein L24
MHKIRKGDQVVVLTGKDKGKRGTVLAIRIDGRALVEGVNIVKRHTRPNPNRGITGGIVDREAPVQLSNLALYDPTTGKGERVGFKTLEDGRKVRFFKKSGEVADLK